MRISCAFYLFAGRSCYCVGPLLFCSVWSRSGTSCMQQPVQHASGWEHHQGGPEEWQDHSVPQGFPWPDRSLLRGRWRPRRHECDPGQDTSHCLDRNCVYWRLARTDKGDVDFIAWPANESRDLLAEDQKVIFQEYKRNPDGHCLPPRFHEDAVWSQELIGKLLRGEDIPRTITVRRQSLFGAEVSTTYHPPSLLPSADMKVKVKQEKATQVFKALKRMPRTTIDLSSPSPAPAKRPRPSSSGPPNPDFLGMQEDESFPNVGEGDDLTSALEEAMDDLAAEGEWSCWCNRDESIWRRSPEILSLRDWEKDCLAIVQWSFHHRAMKTDKKRKFVAVCLHMTEPDHLAELVLSCLLILKSQTWCYLLLGMRL